MVGTGTFLLVALATSTPSQVPQRTVVYSPVVSYATPAYVESGPIAVPAYHCGAGYCPDGPGFCGPRSNPCGNGWNLEEKIRAFGRWLTYRPLYKTPCCHKTCAAPRPPLYAWFTTCVNGQPHPMPCPAPANPCPSCLHFKPRFGAPTGCATCAPRP